MLRPLHGIQDQEKLESIKRDMNVNGWRGRNILVIDMGDYMQALTGSHRIVAAEETATEIPTSVISNQMFNEICEDCGWDVDMVMRDLDGFCADLKDYDAELADLLGQDL